MSSISISPEGAYEHSISVKARSPAVERLRAEAYARGALCDIDAAVVAEASCGDNPELLAICLRYLHLFFGTNRDGPTGPAVTFTIALQAGKMPMCARALRALVLSQNADARPRSSRGRRGPDPERAALVSLLDSMEHLAPPSERAPPDLARELEERGRRGSIPPDQGPLPFYMAACACHPLRVRFRCDDGRDVLFEREALERAPVPRPVPPPRLFGEVVKNLRNNQWVAVCERTRTVYAHSEGPGERFIPRFVVTKSGAARVWIRGSLQPLPRGAAPSCGNDACRAPRAALRCRYCGRVAYCGPPCAMADLPRHAGECATSSPCDACGRAGSTVHCSCAAARYCGAACQRADWKRHRATCAARGAPAGRPSSAPAPPSSPAAVP